MGNEATDLLVVRDLTKYFPLRGGFNPFSRSRRVVRAVDGVSLRVPRGKTLAIVGESGCGKTTLARSITLLTRPTSGEIIFDGRNILDGSVSSKALYEGMQMVFQDPDSSLDPRMRIADIISQPLRGLLGKGDDEVEPLIRQCMSAVGLQEELARRLPRQLSGGQRQRVAIARAIATSPKLVVLDEPTSALDASVQAQILNLLLDLQRQFGLSYVVITHNISVAHYFSDSICVMYAGKVVEQGPTSAVIGKPRHPYTIALINSAPSLDPVGRRLLNVQVEGEIPSAINPPSGCRFNPRCPYAEELCKEQSPELLEISPLHSAACHFVEKTA